MRKIKRYLTACFVLGLIFIMLGCKNSGREEEKGQIRDSVIVAMKPESEPEAGFDPVYGWGAGEHVHEPLIQSTLTVTTKDLEIAYDLATEIELSEDGLVWTVNIRDGVYFTDGEPLTASDVVFTYNTMKENSTLNDFSMLEYAEEVDDKTVKFHMNRPYSIWPYSMANVGIIPQHAYGTDYAERPIGSGRYVLKQWDKGQQVILEANPDYYGEKSKMRTVTVVFMEEDAAFAAAQAGAVDLAYTDAVYVQQKIDGYELLAVETVDNRGINLPAIASNEESGNDFTCEAAVRKALNIGIDREALIEHVLDGYGSPAYSVCDKMPWFDERSVVAYDFDQALQLLEEAGWEDGEDGIRVKEGKRAAFTIFYPAGDSTRQSLAAEVSNQMQLLGIDTSYEGISWDSAYAKAQSEGLVWGWGAHTPMELYNIYHTKEDTALAEYSPYANEQVDAYMDEALAADSLEESYELWKKAQWDGEMGITEDVPWLWLVNINHLYWVSEDLKVAEQKIHPHGHGWSIVNNVDKWSWE